MRKIKKFFEMFEDRYDYDRIITILKKTHGWGFGVINDIDEFESNEEYFLDPIDDNMYAEMFHIYLTDKKCGRLRGQYNNDSKLRVGRWKTGVQVNKPISIWSQRM